MNGLAERTEIRANFDLRRNYLALALCLVKHKYSVNKAINRIYGPIIETGARREINSWTEEELQRIDDLRSQGLTWREIGAEMNAPPQSLHAVWTRHFKGGVEQDGAS
ncbi:MAG: hypothetical protein PHG75_08770 [Syntrophomonas sp.]|nr:hypothetical protein [Syntrophomonas sp.]